MVNSSSFFKDVSKQHKADFIPNLQRYKLKQDGQQKKDNNQN